MLPPVQTMPPTPPTPKRAETSMPTHQVYTGRSSQSRKDWLSDQALIYGGSIDCTANDSDRIGITYRNRQGVRTNHLYGRDDLAVEMGGSGSSKDSNGRKSGIRVVSGSAAVSRSPSTITIHTNGELGTDTNAPDASNKTSEINTEDSPFYDRQAAKRERDRVRADKADKANRRLSEKRARGLAPAPLSIPQSHKKTALDSSPSASPSPSPASSEKEGKKKESGFQKILTKFGITGGGASPTTEKSRFMYFENAEALGGKSEKKEAGEERRGNTGEGATAGFTTATATSTSTPSVDKQKEKKKDKESEKNPNSNADSKLQKQHRRRSVSSSSSSVDTGRTAASTSTTGPQRSDSERRRRRSSVDMEKRPSVDIDRNHTHTSNTRPAHRRRHSSDGSGTIPPREKDRAVGLGGLVLLPASRR